MQWLVNRLEEYKKELQGKIDAAIAAWAQGQINDATEFEKLKGEIKALKARMGKQQKEQARDDGS